MAEYLEGSWEEPLMQPSVPPFLSGRGLVPFRNPLEPFSEAALPPVPLMFEAFGQFWEIQAQLGVGSSATVYQVRPGDGAVPTAAVKEFMRDLLNGEYGFCKERATLEELQGHRNIVTLFGVFTNNLSAKGPTRCLLLELLDISVSELLLRSCQQGCSLWLIQHCARDVLGALAFIHHKGHVHADLKPRNILWSAEEECFKLIDFGLSFRAGNQDVKYIQTDGYRAPEAELQNLLAQAGLQSEMDCTSAVDMWSLGIVLLEMFSGTKLKHTVRSQEWKANSSAIIDHIFASKGVVNSAIPAYHLRDLIKSMLHNDPGKRITAGTALCSPFFSIPFAPHVEDLVMLPTPVLRLLNVLDENCLEGEKDYEDAVEDLREVCQKYGPIVSLFVPKENPSKGQVFIEYANAGDAKAAQKMLTGKMLAGRLVIATFYPLSAYKKGYLYQTLL